MKPSRIAWLCIDLVAIAAAVALVAFFGAPAETLVSVISVLVAVRAGVAGKRRDDDDDNHDDDDPGPIAGVQRTPRLGGARSSPFTRAARDCSVVAIVRGAALLARDAYRSCGIEPTPARR